MLALQTAHCDPRAGWSHPEREEAEMGSGVGRGGGGSWAGDQSRIVSWSPVADKQLSRQPRQTKEGLPRCESPSGPPCPLLPVSPARLPGLGLLAPNLGRWWRHGWTSGSITPCKTQSKSSHSLSLSLPVFKTWVTLPPLEIGVETGGNGRL